MDRDVMTVIEVTAFDGALNSVVPGVGVLVVLAVGLGAVTVTLLSRATSSDVR